MRRDTRTFDTFHFFPSPHRIALDDEELEGLEALLKGKEAPERVPSHKYSPAIAKLLNPSQPDIAAAALFYQISLRQKNPCPKPWNVVGRYDLRSLHRLSQECPYLSKPGVAKAIQRMRTKFKDGFIVRTDFLKCAYIISEDLMKLQKEDSLVSFNPADAAFHNSIRTAVLLGLMRREMRNPVSWTLDEGGNRYVHMSPSQLSREFGYSTDTISRCMKALCQSGVVCPHPEQPQWYTFTSMKESPGNSLFARKTHR